MAVSPLRKKSLSAAPKGIPEAEWQLRVDLAAAYQLVDLYGFTDLSSNHISVRVPGPEHHFLLNPLGVLYDQITASSLIKIDVDGRVLDGDPSQLNPAGFVIHGAIHMAQRDLICVLHTHTRANNAIATLKDGLLPLNQKAFSIMASLRYHDYEGPSLDNDERERLVKNLGDGRIMCLRNHGALTVGRSIAEAWVHMYRYEMACRYQVDTLACAGAGFKLKLPSKAIVKRSIERAAQTLGPGKIMVAGATEWPSLLRKLERERGTTHRS